MNSKNSLKIPPRPILIIHPTEKIMILTVNKRIYGFYYDETSNKYFDTSIEYNKDYKKAIKKWNMYILENYGGYSKEVVKTKANERTDYIIKELATAIKNRSNRHVNKANDLQTATIKDFLKKHDVKDIEKLFTADTNESGTQKALKKIETNEKENKAMLESLKKEVLTKYNGNYIDYAMDKSKHLILNESKNIAKQILMSFMVAIKSQSLFNEIHGRADSGKSYIFKVSLDNYIPDEYVIELNSSTLASFINKCKGDPYYYDGKIIYIGDLGDKETYERMKQIFNVLKIVISEGSYKDSKNQQVGNEWKPLDIEIIGKIGAFYCSVFEDNEDKTNQLDSRAISSTPALNNPNEKILFKENVKIIGTVENAYYEKTTKELKAFREYFKESIINYDKNIHMVINPFFMIFNEITKHRLTETRELANMNEMFKSYLILILERCFIFNKTVNNKEVVYIIPKIEDVQKFINIIYSSVGLKQYEKNLLLKLKKELDFITPDHANDLYDELEENEHVNNHRNESKLINETMKKLFLRNGMNNQTSTNKKDQATLENNNYDNKKYFFRSSDIYSKFQRHKAIKDIENLNETMRYLADRGFLGKLENKYNRANVYFLNKEYIDDINEDYILTDEDIETAINHFHENFKENPLDPNSKSLFNNDEMMKIQKNYNLFDISKIERYD